MKVLAIFCSDIHLSETAPPARSAEPDWMEAQGRVLDQLDGLIQKYNCPIICAGDLFHRHNPQPALINWAIDHLPEMYTVPGQHDLPFHRYDDIERSAYWTLVKTKTIIDITQAQWWRGVGLDDLLLYGFAWGFEPSADDRRIDDRLQVAVSHRFVWTQGKGYEGAPVGCLDGPTAELYKDFDVAVFGDNHQGFSQDRHRTRACPAIFNCGCLIRRKANERDYKPRVGLLMSDGTIDTHYLDLTGDVWADQPDDEPEMTEMLEDLGSFISELKDADVGIIDFEESINRWLDGHDCSEPVRKILLEVTELK